MVQSNFNNIPEMFIDRVHSMGNAVAILYKDGGLRFQHITWGNFAELCSNVAFGLLDIGFEPRRPVVIFAGNSYNWIACDLGILCVGGISVPIYPTSSAQDVDYILHNSEASIAFVQGTDQLNKLLSSDFTQLKKIIVLHKPPSEGLGDAQTQGANSKEKRERLDDVCIAFDELVAGGAALRRKSPELLDERLRGVKRNDLATLIYTSGTTGTPKGAMLTHGNILSVVTDIAPIIPTGMHDVYLSYLPLSHVFERVAGEFYWIYNGGIFAIAESIEKFARDFAEVQPSMLLVVPRILDRIYMKVQSGIKEAPLVTRKLVEWAISIGNKVVETRGTGQRISGWLKFEHSLAKRLALRKLRRKIGSRLKLIVSGSAPATPEVIRFFNAIGICTLEGYGLTETAAPVTVNLPSKIRVGTVGPTLNSVELKLAPDGEILVRGPSVFVGYYKNEPETARAFEGGWFHTGDIGTIDAEGHLIITDRKKDIIVNAAGKNIAPQRIESLLNEIPIVSQSIVFGDRQKCLVVLFTLDETAAMSLAKEQGWQINDFAQLCRSRELQRYLREQINARSKDLTDYEKIRQFAVLPHSLSVEEGELTPTLKVKRAVVAQRYSDLINSLFQAESLVAVYN